MKTDTYNLVITNNTYNKALQFSHSHTLKLANHKASICFTYIIMHLNLPHQELYTFTKADISGCVLILRMYIETLQLDHPK